MLQWLYQNNNETCVSKEGGRIMGTVNPERRRMLKSGLLVSASSVTLACTGGNGPPATPLRTSPDGLTEPGIRTPRQIGPLFLAEQEMLTLAALADQLIPPDTSPGGAEAGCHEGIQRLLSAFSFDPPMIFAGGPYSNRGGSAINHFEQFVALDSYDELAWRIRLEGSQGRPEETHTGVIKGWQAIYRDGLAALNRESARYGASAFQDLAVPLQALVLNSAQAPELLELVDIAFPHCLQFMYGPPEYGGNKSLVGWKAISFEGDVQPRGYRREQVVKPDNLGLTELLGLFRLGINAPGYSQGRQASQAAPGEGPMPLAALLPVPTLDESVLLNQVVRELALMGSDEFSLAMTVGSESRLSRMRSFVKGKSAKNADNPGEAA